MDYEQIIKDIIYLYENNCGQQISTDDAVEILQALLSERDTANILESSPRHLLQIVFENKNFYDQCIFPCDIIELRNLLGENCIKTQTKIILFSNSCAERVIKDKKVKLVLNCGPEKLCKQAAINYKCYGGMCVVHDNTLQVAKMVKHIVVESKGYQQVAAVEKIVKDLNLNIPVYTKSHVPGIDKYKFASTIRKYKINLPDLNINNRITRASTPHDALEEELKKQWNYHPDSDRGRKTRPENYTADFWAKSGFFETIVKKASSQEKIVEADASSGSQYGTGGRISGEGSTMDFVGVTTLKRYEPGASAGISKGDRYVSKEGGIFGVGREYEVVGIYSDNTVKLRDKNGHTIKVDISVQLPAKFRKV